MKISRLVRPFALFSILSVLLPDALAQGPVAVKIKKLNVEEQITPKFNVDLVTEKRVSRNQKWLEFEVEFEAAKAPAAGDASPFIDDLLFKYYVVFKHNDPVTGKPVMATGQVTHVNVEPKTDMRSVMYITPSAVSRIRGKVGAASKVSDVQAFAVQVIYQGQEIAVDATAGGAAKWWASGIYPPRDGVLLKKSDTPFAPLWYDYHAEVKVER